jgi:hypothetical protein
MIGCKQSVVPRKEKLLAANTSTHSPGPGPPRKPVPGQILR